MKGKTITLLLSVLLAAGALAGCASNDEDDAPPTTTTPTQVTPTEATPATTPVVTTPTNVTPTTVVTPTVDAVTPSSFSLTAAGFPAQVEVGKKFNFTLYVNGSPARTSDHVGAHFAGNDTSPPTAPGRKDCEHPNGAMPGVFVVNCTIQEPGTWHVFGHARLNESGELVNFWATPFAVKARAFNLTVTNMPTAPQVSKGNFTFTLTINGTENVTSDHIGAHFWNATTETPTVANSAGACAHLPGETGAVGTFTVTCSIENKETGPKDFFLRGHVRVTEGGSALNFWSTEQKVSIVGSSLI